MFPIPCPVWLARALLPRVEQWVRPRGCQPLVGCRGSVEQTAHQLHGDFNKGLATDCLPHQRGLTGMSVVRDRRDTHESAGRLTLEASARDLRRLDEPAA